MKIFILLMILSVNIFTQKIEDIETDRPDRTESAGIVPEEFFQFEIGGSMESEKYSYPSAPSYSIRERALPSLLVRHGILKNLELRLGIEYFTRSFSHNNNKTHGLGPVSVGAKIKIMEEKEAAPETAFLFHVIFPLKNNDVFQPEYIGADFRFAMKHSLSKRFSLSYNLGGEWSGDDPRATGIYTLSLGISLVKRLSVFVESYGFLTQKETPDHRFDGGFTFLIAKNFQADVSGGIGITDISPDYFIGAGLSFRLPR